MAKKQQDAKKKVEKVKKVKVTIVDQTEIDFGDMVIRQTNFSDGTSSADVI